jgi:hypothetical protein
VLFRADELRAIRDGVITLAFRRWTAPRVRVGTRLRTAIGLVEIRSVGAVPTGRLTDDEAVRAGHASGAALRTALAARTDRPVYRIELAYAGPDPRIALRADDSDPAAVRAALIRLDHREPWTGRVLRLIADNPGVRAADLAERLGRETLPFKRDVRKLKELGLTESLEIGYRLSPRGRAVLAEDRSQPS